MVDFDSVQIKYSLRPMT